MMDAKTIAEGLGNPRGNLSEYIKPEDHTDPRMRDAHDKANRGWILLMGARKLVKDAGDINGFQMLLQVTDQVASVIEKVFEVESK